MDSSSLSYKTLKNVSYNFFAFFAPFIFSIFVTPVVVLRLGVERYGVYLLVLSVGVIMGLFDLGIGNTLIKYISEYDAAKEEKRMRDLIYSFNTILLGLALFGLAVFVSVGYWAHAIYPSQIISNGSYFIFFLMAGLVFFISTISAIFTVVPVAMQRFDISNTIGLINMTLSSLTVLIIVLLGYGLKAIFLSQIFYALFVFFVYRHYANKLLPAVSLKYNWVWSEIKHAYKFGIATYISNAANSALTYFDRLLIPIYLGPSALSYYSLPGNITAKTSGLINNVSGVIFPMISGLNGINDTEKISSIYTRTFRLVTVLCFAATISVILFANKILFYWLNADFAERSTGVLILLAATYYLLSLSGMLNSFLLGLSKTKFLFQASSFMAIINVALLFVLLPKYGIVGAAWAYLVSVLPIIFMFYHTEKKFLKLTGRFTYYSKLYFKLVVSALPFVAIVEFMILPLVTSLKILIVLGPVSVVLFLIIYRLFGFYEQEDLRVLNDFFIAVTRKLRFINNSQIND